MNKDKKLNVSIKTDKEKYLHAKRLK
jgi:hypothetical protein